MHKDMAVVIRQRWFLRQPILSYGSRQETEMSKDKNFFQRAFDAMIEGRTRQAERYVARINSESTTGSRKVNGR
jgi:hypothetical protein